MLFRRGAVWTFRKVVPKECHSILGRTAFVTSLRTTDLETAKKLLPVEALKATRAIEAARLTVQRGPQATVDRVAARLTTEYRKVYPFGVQRDVDADTAEDAFAQVTEADVLADELERLTDRLSAKVSPHAAIEVRAKITAIRALLNGDGGKDHGPLLSAVFDQWRAERRPTVKTWLEFKRTLEGFTETFGDLPVRAIKREHVAAWKRTLLESKSRKKGEKNANKIIRPATVQKLTNGLRSVLEWAVRQGLVETNVAHGVSRVAALDAKGLTAGDERQLPFSVEQARTILTKLEDYPVVPLRWLWRIAFYSGMRRAEVVGIRQEDVQEVDGILSFVLRPHEGRGLKSKSSRRIVPVHDELLRLGFTKDVLPFRSSTGSLMSPHYLGRVANEWLRKNITTDPRLTLHSTRHAFKDRLRAARVPEQEQRALMGHSARGVADSYGLGFPVSVLRDGVNAVKY